MAAGNRVLDELIGGYPHVGAVGVHCGWAAEAEVELSEPESRQTSGLGLRENSRYPVTVTKPVMNV